MFQFWLVWKYLKKKKTFFNLTTILSIFGMMIGVASMVVAMAVISGYETTLKRSVIDVMGHLFVIKRGSYKKGAEDVLEAVRPLAKGIKATTPFVVVDAAIAHNKKLTGVVIQGVDSETIHKVLRLKNRVIEGKFDLSPQDEIAGALIGQGIAKRFELEVGEVFRMVMPIGDQYDSESFRPRLKKFVVNGVLDIGRHDFNNRYVITEMSDAQEFAGIGDRVTGYRFRFHEDDQAPAANFRIANELGFQYFSRSWLDIESNLFEAAKIEKVAIFFVLLVMIIAACFNISSTLFVSVLRRYSDISILKAMGAQKKLIIKIFTFQGLIIGVVGTLMGFALGLLACYGFLYLQEHFGVISGQVYKVNKIQVELRSFDFIAIFVASMIICFISTLAPALRGARMIPTEGLHYE